jgi:peptidoglycan/xylan/chitin deacetylase (PgdA/CDA1 family)
MSWWGDAMLTERLLIAFTLLVALFAGGAGCALGDGDERRLGLLGERDPRVLYSAEISEPVVALTIDDAPDSETTPEILAVLQRHGARATFFVIADQISGNESLLERIVSEGHELGNHMTRDEPSVALGPDDFERELLRAGEMLARFGGTRWYRPGSGYYSDEMLDIVDRHGYRCVLGSIYPADAQLPWSGLAAWWIDARTEPGAVIILHDRGERGRRTAETLSEVLPELSARGYRVVTLSELAALAELAKRGSPPRRACRPPSGGRG